MFEKVRICDLAMEMTRRKSVSLCKFKVMKMKNDGTEKLKPLKFIAFSMCCAVAFEKKNRHKLKLLSKKCRFRCIFKKTLKQAKNITDKFFLIKILSVNV